MPAPDSPQTAAQWLRVGAEKILEGIELSPGEIRTLLAIDAEAERSRSDNAFWPQMRAVLLSKIGRSDESRQAWVRASNCTAWDEYQSSLLLKDRTQLVASIGWDQAWTFGYVFFQRSDAAAAVIQRYAQLLVRETGFDSVTDLKLRYATIRNGSLLRDGSRSIRVGAHGWQMVELATYPPSLETRSPKRIWIAETTLTSRLRQAGLTDEAKRAKEDLGNNEGWLFLIGAAPPDEEASAPIAGSGGFWRTLTEEQGPEDNVRILCLAAIALAALPGILVVGSAFFGTLLLAGIVLQRRLESMRFFPTWAVTFAALLLGITVFALTRLWPAALSVAAAVQFLAVGPGVPRTRKSNDLGPLHGFVLSCISVISFAGLALYLISSSVAANTVGPYLGPSGEYLASSGMFLAVGAIVLSLICLVTPLWAIARRFGTPDLFGLSLRRLGSLGAIGCLAACVVGGPLAVFGDKIVSNELLQIVENEPVYYLVAK